MIDKVKTNLGITGIYQDSTIQGYIDEVKQFMLDAGVQKEVVDAETSVGVITRGVADLWNYGSGGTQLSPYFFQRVIQLASKMKGQDDVPVLDSNEVDEDVQATSKL
ncbi:hypothetical protein [Bacteroides caecimuris]|uniref:hypothetical protein n=1 Tax=Bacteroides caecimuris TaxID=1796613 RepID=UPI00256FB42B|nr:hypothetical protein [Bacteroides caecimuris]